MVRKLMLCLAALAVAFIVSAPVMAAKDSSDDTKTAKKKGKKKGKGLRGKIVKVDGNNLTIVSGKKAKETTVEVPDATPVTLDGKTAKLADLKADMFVGIAMKDDKVSNVKAFTKKPERKKKKNG